MAVLTFCATAEFAQSGVPVYRVLPAAKDLPKPFCTFREFGNTPIVDLGRWARILNDSLDRTFIPAALETHIRIKNGFLEFILLPPGQSIDGFVPPAPTSTGPPPGAFGHLLLGIRWEI